MNDIERYYEERYDEWNRLARHKIEFDITKRYLNEFIQGERLDIFDIGGGPGRYSIYLAGKGHQVTLLDLAKGHLDLAKEKAQEAGVELADYIHGNALALDGTDAQYDAVLLMGPLYHLTKEEDRRKAAAEAVRVLKPGGLLVASFISSYAPLMDMLMEPAAIESPEELLVYLADGENRPEKGFTTAYFTSYHEARELMAASGLTELAFAGVENVLGLREPEINGLTETEYRKWLEIGYQLSRDRNVIGTSMHYLYIGRK
ncbi:class I SAM-dependent methyltransferase [Gorillibacterium massiliense]|uniref:class I SAM-dependent methyltransferase n=1 Tax=Gorillibacterium massiliense TaxID=1280390 RepID=UPI0004B13395|nr:class I SAM-dependent methyltransferase [Gorillibacterium massiliense]